jgi:Tol biopolymer transport system component
MDKATKQGSLSLISLSGGPSRELVRFAPGKGIALSGWTPDGRSIVYVQASSQSDGAEAGSANTWMIPIDGGPARKIELNEEAGQLRVHPDGKQIAYWIPNRTPEQVWVLENLARKLPAR